MEEYFEDTTENGKLYNREVLKLLFSYVIRYKKYLFTALFFVLLITSANLIVPYLLKTIVDRFIFKQGRVVYLVNETLEGDNIPLEKKLLRKSIHLSGDSYFLFQSQLKYLAKGEIESLESAGILSKQSYVLIELPDLRTPLKAKLENFVRGGDILIFKGIIYLMNIDVLTRFSVREIIELRGSDFEHIVLYVLIIILILLVQFGASYVQIIYLMRLSQLAMKDLRRDLFTHIVTFEVSFFDRNPIGKLVNRVTNDIETLNELFSSVLVTLFQDLLMMLGIALVMFLTDLYLASVVAITFPFIVVLTIFFRIKVRNAYRVIRTKITELNSFFNESITGIRIIQIFVREMKNFMQFSILNNAVFSAQLKQLYVYAIFRPLISFLRWFAMAAVIYFGARGIGLDKVSYGLLVMFVAYIERFFAPVHDFSEKFDIMQSANAAGEKIISLFRSETGHELLLNRNEIELEDDMYRSVSFIPAGDRRLRGEILFDNVWFAYEPDEWVLKGVSFSVKPKERLAIIGETGAGKTTITNLLTKFYRAQRGKILIDGVNIDDMPHWKIRENFVSVMQDVFLFSRSVRDNITLGRTYDEECFKTVSRATHVDKFINGLPNGESEPVMERGATFSTGERQLLSFARALYFNPSVLVLDEATSNIDTETEKLIQDAIMNLTKGRTSIVIAHRLSTIKNADNIIVLDRGKIVEEGRHRDLLTKRGIYHKLYTLQFSNMG